MSAISNNIIEVNPIKKSDSSNRTTHQKNRIYIFHIQHSFT